MSNKSFLIAAALLASATTAFAQSNFQESVTTHRRDSSQSLGRDFWFAPVMNDTGSKGNKSITLYISSPVNTTAYVESQGRIKSISIPANGVGTFNVPLAWEMKSSSVAENKGIHVYSDTGDLSVYLMSTSSAGSNGMYCIPSIGFGTDYVVAGYGSFFDSSHTNSDYPSEFTVTANQDNTEVEITPTVDCRLSTQYPTGATTAGFPQGTLGAFTLSRGQCVQLQAVLAQDQFDYNLTGSIIHSNVPVGVVAGSMSPNLPPAFPGRNYICTMLPPVRTWGETYYTTSSVQPPSLTDHDFNLYCMVSSAPNQIFYRYNCNIGFVTEAELGPKYDHYYAEEQGANKWFSDQPFMLVQYINSPGYPDSINGRGYPAEVVIDSKENYSKTVFFQAADSAGLGSADTNYANVVVNLKDINHVTIDGKLIHNYAYSCLDGTYGIYLVPNLAPGAHEVKSDSGVGVYVYGYGHSVAYEWAGSMGAWTNGSPDSTAPAISFTPGGSCLHTTISDLGSGLAEIILDSTNNLTFSVDTNSELIPGDTGCLADFCAIDVTQVGYLQFTAYDLAGNHTVVTIEYGPFPAGFTAETTRTFDTVQVGTKKTIALFNITDTTQAFSLTIDSLWTDDPAFTINKSLFGNSLPITLNPGGWHLFSVTFSPTVAKTYSANAFALGTGFEPRSAPLSGIGYTQSVVGETHTKVCSTMALSPNPAAKFVSLDFSLLQVADVCFKVFSTDGKNVLNWNANAFSMGEHLQPIDVSSLAEDNYVYRFEANGEVISGKLSVIR